MKFKDSDVRAVADGTCVSQISVRRFCAISECLRQSDYLYRIVWYRWCRFQHYKISGNRRQTARLSFHYLIREETVPPLHRFAVPTKPKVYPYVSATRREAFVNQTDFPPLCYVIKLFRLLAFALSRTIHPPPVLLIVTAKICKPVCVRMPWRYSLIIVRKWT